MRKTEILSVVAAISLVGLCALPAADASNRFGHGSRATNIADQMLAQWKSSLIDAARDNRTATFPNRSRAVLQARLNRLSNQLGFTVSSIEMLHPLQSAPVVRLSWPVTKAEMTSGGAVPSVTASIPRALTDAVPRWAYEGGFIEAITTDGAPLAVYYFLQRGRTRSDTWIDPHLSFNTAHGSP